MNTFSIRPVRGDDGLGLELTQTGPHLIGLGSDKLVTFHMILASYIERLGYTWDNPRDQGVIYEDDEGPRGKHLSSNILGWDMNVGETRISSELKWDLSPRGRSSLYIVMQAPRFQIQFEILSALLDSINAAVRDTLGTLQTRGILKASREDLVAQLYKPSRVGVDEATFNRYFPEEGDEMYGTFKFRGGKKIAKRSKRSKRTTRRRTVSYK
jgi:hypothetical protein